MAEEILNACTVRELKNMLEEVGEKTTGNKNEFVLRLLEFPEESHRLLHERKRKAESSSSSGSVAEMEEQRGGGDTAKIIEKMNAVGGTKKKSEQRIDNKLCVEEANESKERSVSKENELKMREIELMKKEMKIMEREMELQKREIELLKIENEILKNKNGGADEDKNVLKVSFWVVKDLLSDFYGNGDNFELWSTQLKNIKTNYNLDDNTMRALISNKLKDKALKWLHSRRDLTTVSIENLLADMKSLFEDRSSRLTLKRAFENRKWKSGESFQEYFYEKNILASKAMIDESEMVEYLIEGISDYTLRSFAQMQCFKGKNQMLQAFHAVDLAKIKERQSGASDGKAKGIRCFNCNSLGHVLNECRKPKREVGACYVCAEKGHLAAVCPKRKPNQIHAVLREKLEENNEHEFRKDLRCLRASASRKMEECQAYNKNLKDRNRVDKVYNVGGYEYVKNSVSDTGACRKIIPKYKGPYRITKSLPNDWLKEKSGRFRVRMAELWQHC